MKRGRSLSRRAGLSRPDALVPDHQHRADPRWGRTQETYGEDPFLTSRLAVEFVKGIQGDDPKYLKCVATPKHFAMHNQETGRTSSSFDISERTLREYYLPAFYACFTEGHAY